MLGRRHFLLEQRPEVPPLLLLRLHSRHFESSSRNRFLLFLWLLVLFTLRLHLCLRLCRLYLGNFPIQCPSCKASALDRPEKGRESQVQGLLNIGALLFLEQRGVIQKALFYRLIRSSAQAGVPLLKEGGGVALGELLKKGERKAKSAGHSEKEAEDVISSWLPCPAVGCNRTLLTLHPKYKDLGLGAFFDNVKEHQTCVRLGVCPCGALLCPRCKQLVKPAEARSHMCKTARKAVDVEEEKKTMAVMRKVTARLLCS